MSARSLFEATIGRRLLVRIWAHGVLLFAGVLAVVMGARHVMWELDASAVLRARPYLVAAAAERVLSRAAEPEAMARELRLLDESTPLTLTVYAADGRQLGTSAGPALAPPTNEERQHAVARPGGVRSSSDRLVVAGGPGGAPLFAVVRTPGPPSLPWHAGGLVLSALILGFVFVAGPLTRAIARPIERLEALARKLGAGDLSVRAATDRHDEIGDLARSFNVMAGQLQRLRAAERQLLGDVSHELRTPLARMRVVLDLATTAEADRVRRYLGEITTDLDELEQLCDDIIVSSRLDRDAPHWDEARPPLRRSRTRVDDLVQSSLDRFRARWPDRLVRVIDGAAEQSIDCDPTLLRRALDNLLDNARKFSPDDRPIVLEVSLDGDAVRAEVIDEGIGIALDDHPRVFAAFYRADRSRNRTTGGVGLGLVLTRRIVEAHGGAVGFTSALDRGSRFWFTLAVASPTER